MDALSNKEHTAVGRSNGKGWLHLVLKHPNYSTIIKFSSGHTVTNNGMYVPTITTNFTLMVSAYTWF